MKVFVQGEHTEGDLDQSRVSEKTTLLGSNFSLNRIYIVKI